MDAALADYRLADNFSIMPGSSKNPPDDQEVPDFAASHVLPEDEQAASNGEIRDAPTAEIFALDNYVDQEMNDAIESQLEFMQVYHKDTTFVEVWRSGKNVHKY